MKFHRNGEKQQNRFIGRRSGGGLFGREEVVQGDSIESHRSAGLQKEIV